MRSVCEATLVVPFVAAMLNGFSNEAIAAPITPGDLVIYRVGDGVTPLASNATAAIFLDEYTPAGTLVQSIPVPSTGTSAVTALGTGASTGQTEGILTLSTDSTSLVYTGYRVPAGTASQTVAMASTVRDVNTLSVADGATMASYGITDLGSNAIRSATTANGSTFYLGTAAGLRYLSNPSTAGSTSVVISSLNTRGVLVAPDNTLYASNGSGTPRFYSYGMNPTGTTTGTGFVSTQTGDAANGFMFADLSPTIPGIDTLYFFDKANADVLKYTFDGTNWNASGSATTSLSNVNGNLTLSDVGGVVQLYVTTDQALSEVTDTSGYGGTLTGSLTTLATPAANEAFRGVVDIPALTATPEPAAAVLFTMPVLSLLVRRRRANCA